MPKTILLVEDDQDILDIMMYMLSDEGYRLLRSNGDDALQLATTELPDLVLLDHRLQTVWGADICRALKADERTKAIPVIMVSAAMNIEATAKAAGADRLVAKPFGLQEMLAVVADTLEQGGRSSGFGDIPA
ncbi:response regulator [Mucilaginibacter corticis]|uniref:Response regulator n=1 Tax=Mucilaginibacter corticis TaxID=2597670 RepID=A0A556MXD8_9SPHI|nr:response regulator [Mucilaginibacter corticis]TSJ44488.1 response regulator [Mucilaginibacter corticis]